MIYCRLHSLRTSCCGLATEKRQGKMVPKACFVIFFCFLAFCTAGWTGARLTSLLAAQWGTPEAQPPLHCQIIPSHSLEPDELCNKKFSGVVHDQDLNLQTGPLQLLPVCVPSAPSASLQRLQQTKHTLSFFLFYFLTFYVSPVWKLTCFEFVPLSSALLGSTKT